MIDVTNGTISNLTGSNNVYLATLKPISKSTISVSVPSGSVKDAASNFNESGSNIFTWTYDSDTNQLCPFQMHPSQMAAKRERRSKPI